MSDATVVILGSVAALLIFSVLLAPMIGAAMSGRPMTHAEKEVVGWGCLGVAFALFLLGLFLIGEN